MSTTELPGDAQFVESLTHAKGRDLISLFA
jgi:hypothetical protein